MFFKRIFCKVIHSQEKLFESISVKKNILGKKSYGSFTSITDICATRLGWFMMFNATFKNISVILWLSVLFVKEIRVSRESN